jgi:Cu/Ag efflux pump CusA
VDSQNLRRRHLTESHLASAAAKIANLVHGPTLKQNQLQPVLMTSLAAPLGMLPLAYGIGSGADMLKPLAIAVMGALVISVLLSLVATPAVCYALSRLSGGAARTAGITLTPRPTANRPTRGRRRSPC